MKRLPSCIRISLTLILFGDDIGGQGFDHWPGEADARYAESRRDCRTSQYDTQYSKDDPSGPFNYEFSSSDDLLRMTKTKVKVGLCSRIDFIISLTNSCPI